FSYVVSATGVTGVRTEVAKGVKTMIDQLKEITDKPIAVGFGISQPEHAKQVIDWNADGAIVGSAMVKKLAEPDGGLYEIAELCKTLKQSIRRD
ncbi:MAG: tryptophan synthase subunit alpha, partial [Pseudanabaena sp.]